MWKKREGVIYKVIEKTDPRISCGKYSLEESGLE